MLTKRTPGFPIFFFSTCLLLVVTGIAVWFREWPLIAPLTLSLAYLLLQMWKAYQAPFRKIRILFDAVENNDFAFRFPERGSSTTDHKINNILNALSGVLSKAKMDAAEKEKYYELILDRVSTGIVVIDNQGFVYQTNDAALALLGLPVLTHTRQLAHADEQLPALIDALSPGSSRQIVIHTERGEKYLTVDIAVLKGKNKDLRIVALNDIDSELDENEIESWSRLTRVLTHEIMNGISPITSLSELLLKKEDAHGSLRDGLEVIHHTGTQLTSFVNSYRKFSRIPEPVKTIFDLREFILMEVTGMRATTDLPIDFQIEVEPKELMLYADKNLISQVMLNILRNAILALQDTPNPYIHITAQSDARERILIDIDNNGPVIPTEVGKQIFVPFFTTREQGSGIGLSVSKQIMRVHNGSLKLTYSTPKETRFTLLFK